MNVSEINDQLLHRIMASFPNLAEIRLNTVSITDAGFRTLLGFSSPSLRCIDISSARTVYIDYTDFLIGCVELKHLYLKGFYLTPGALFKVTRLCQRLEIISVLHIFGFNAEQTIIEYLPAVFYEWMGGKSEFRFSVYRGKFGRAQTWRRRWRNWKKTVGRILLFLK